MHFQKLRFTNKSGQQLAGRLDLPVARPLAYALFAHCFTCTKNLTAVGNITRALNEAGIAVLRFDFTGLGESEGDFADTNFSTNVSDLVSAADYLSSAHGPPELLIGHSLGGAAILLASQEIATAKAVATIGAPAEPAHVRQLLKNEEDRIVQSGEANVLLAGRPFTIKKQFLTDLEKVNSRETIAALGKALLILHSPIDNIVGVENAASIFTWARHPKSFVSLDRADHLLAREADSLYAGAVIAAWARKYLELPTIPSEPADLTDNLVLVRTDKFGYRTEINASGHSLIADEPVSVGGTNTGPNPYEYLVAALGSCTAMTLRMYADRKGWPLEAVEVRLKHAKIHADDCTACDTNIRKIDQITRELALFGPLSDQQKARLLEIADRCPVHRTLHGRIVVKTTLKSSKRKEKT
jgi:putative redox protein